MGFDFVLCELSDCWNFFLFDDGYYFIFVGYVLVFVMFFDCVIEYYLFGGFISFGECWE